MVRKFAFLLALSVFAAPLKAEEVLYYRSGEKPDPRDVAAILGSHSPAPLKLRSIRLLPDPAAQTASMQPAKPSALALPIQFAFDSANLLPAAAEQLDSIAEGIKLLPSGASVIIEGHTDAHGPDRYNVELSHKRALAVRDYLVHKHGMERTLLKVIAKGEYAPYNNEDPYAAENRRVQFRGG
jgi:outer membrane protein OmpA-like peptidoglycan-associated protein